jgi:hypothetical protein
MCEHNFRAEPDAASRYEYYCTKCLMRIVCSRDDVAFDFTISKELEKLSKDKSKWSKELEKLGKDKLKW